MKIVINRCYGGFGLSITAEDFLGIKNKYDIERTNPKLIEAVDTLGAAVNNTYSQLKIVESPMDPFGKLSNMTAWNV